MSKFLRFLGFLGLLVVVGAAWWLVRIDELEAAGPRTEYFLYLAALCVVTILLARWPRLSGTLLVLACVEFAWGLGSWALAPPGSPSLLPPVTAEPLRFEWHPVLQAAPVPGLAFKSATGLAIRHSSQGHARSRPGPLSTGRGRRRCDLRRVGDLRYRQRRGRHVPERLDELLKGDRLLVVNHGVPGYTTAEHVLQTAFYPEKFGKAPRCAIYFVGWNDLRNAHIPDLDPAYADFHLPSQVDSLKVRRVGGSNVTISPLLTVLARLVSAEVDTVRYGKDPYALPPAGGSDPAQAAIFERNVRSISAINRTRGTPTIWVGQVVNRDRLKGDGRYGWLPRVRDRDLWPLLQQSNALLERTAKTLGDTYVALPVDAFGAADFVDEGHFSAAGARRLAALLAPVVREACR